MLLYAGILLIFSLRLDVADFYLVVKSAEWTRGTGKGVKP